VSPTDELRPGARGRSAAPDPRLLAALERAVPGGVAARATDRLGFAHDASHYLLVPEAVATPGDAGQVASLLQVSAAQGVPLTFRSGGTSLSGQATGAGVLVDTRRNFRGIEVLEEGARVRVQPGATVRETNARLARYARKLGPDPASESACTIGGVVANNSSGMACGIAHNTYMTLDSAVLVLPSGTVLDTCAHDADERLRVLEPTIHAGLGQLRDRVRGNTSSVAVIQRLFALKNTMGYAVNAFLDYTRPVDILLHLVVGSEGTLAFVAEATFRTVPVHPHAATALLVFRDMASATESLPQLVASDLATIELLDAASLRVAKADPTAPSVLTQLDVKRHAALLVEHQQPTAGDLKARVESSRTLMAQFPLVTPAHLSSEPAARAALWHIRKGLYAAVAVARPPGTTAILEDIAVPVERLLPTCTELQRLLDRHGYDGSVIFGHAKDGNIHFLINEDFGASSLVDRYLAFTEDMVDLVLSQGGTLKAEHGTGRIMAPYVGRQYGGELHEVMREVKRLLDPKGLLNPGVLLDDDPQAHLAHLKSTPKVEVEVDRCVECGYCEPVCPSKDLTTTPRRRIVLRREIAHARAAGDLELVSELEYEYEYDAVQTCAVDGMCATACPVLIDTGRLTRRLREEANGPLRQRAGEVAARHWDATTRGASAALTAAGSVPGVIPQTASRLARAVFGAETIPLWSDDLPLGGTRRTVPLGDPERASAVYFPSCLSTVFDAGVADAGVRHAFTTLCQRAGVDVLVPPDIAGLCCGTPWKSKGLTVGFSAMQDRLVDALLDATDHGRLPVVIDASSCTEGLSTALAGVGIAVTDVIAFVETHVLPRLPPATRVPTVVVHPTCSTTRLGLDPALLRVAEAAGERVVVPDDWGCCAFAGDRGLLQPELTASATEAEARAIHALGTTSRDGTAYASANRTCELGMTRATGLPYQHVVELLERSTRPRT
jgi:D-lactate dehydrogenase